jgi:broad specificity phosphatase PhoE
LLGFLIFVVGSFTSVPEGWTEDGDVIERMRSGGHILMIRHALAPGTGDPQTVVLGDCSTQRNLSDEGRDQARAIGDWLREQEIKSARVYSSQWCRCLETAELMALGPVTELPGLNSFYRKTEDREPNLRMLSDFIADQPADGELIIMVTHFVTISAIAGRGTGSGQGVLIELAEDETAPYSVVGSVSF